MSAKAYRISRIFGLCLHITHANSGPAESTCPRNFRKVRGHKIQAVTMWGFEKGFGNSEKSTALQPCRPQEFETCTAALASLDYTSPTLQVTSVQSVFRFGWAALGAAMRQEAMFYLCGQAVRALGDACGSLKQSCQAQTGFGWISSLSAASHKPTYPTSCLPKSPFPGDGERLSRLKSWNRHMVKNRKTLKTHGQRWSDK